MLGAEQCQLIPSQRTVLTISPVEAGEEIAAQQETGVGVQPPKPSVTARAPVKADPTSFLHVETQLRVLDAVQNVHAEYGVMMWALHLGIAA